MWGSKGDFALRFRIDTDDTRKVLNLEAAPSIGLKKSKSEKKSEGDIYGHHTKTEIASSKAK
jgi:hypothetical protein